MAVKREKIIPGLTLVADPDMPGHLTIVMATFNGPLEATLTPEEVDELVLSVLTLTKPEDLDPNAEEDYQAAMHAIRVWQGTRADRESVRQRDAERDAVLGEAGYRSLTYAEAGPAIRFLVDRLIEARKAGQQ